MFRIALLLLIPLPACALDVTPPEQVNISTMTNPPGNHLFVRQDTANQNNGKTVQIQRVSTDDDRHVNPHALSILYRVNQGGDATGKPWAVSAEMVSNTSQSGAEAGTALSGLARKLVANGGVLFGFHAQVKDETGGATQGGIVGAEVNIQANGPDANGNRFGVDVLSRNFGTGPDAQMTAAIRIRDAGDGSNWKRGIEMQGTFSEGALVIPAGQAVVFGGGVTMRYDPATNALVLARNGDVKHTFSMD